MIQRMKGTLIATVMVLLALPFIPQQADAQDGSRFRVLVADLKPTDGTRDRFGERTSDEVRDLIDLPTHVALSSRDADRAAREYDLRLGDLDCVTAQQLATQMSIPLIMCGEYHEVNGEIRYEARFITVPAGEEFSVEPQTLPENQHETAARHILASFENTVEQVQFISWCGSEYNASNWDGAMQYCTRAVELVPESAEARFALARTLMEIEEYQESLDHFRTLLEDDPNSSQYLENAGWVAAQLDETDEARDYYTRFLERNPDNVQVRLRVAYDLAQTGDAYGAMTLLEEGFERDPDHVDLHEQYGSYAFRAAIDLQQQRPQAQQQDGDQPALDPEVAELFRTAIASLDVVLEERGSESRTQYVVNSMRAYLQLNEPEEAIALGQRGTEWFPENADILSQLATAHNRVGNIDEAVASLSAALEINPDLANARGRMANYYLEADRIDDAVDMIHSAAEAGDQSPDALGGILLSHGFSQGVQAGDYEMGIRLFEAIKEMDVSDEFRSQTNFFHGYALYEQGRALQEPQTVESAQRTLPMFQEALEHLRAGELYAQENPGSNLNQIIDATNQFIEIQDAIIRRGSR